MSELDYAPRAGAATAAHAPGHTSDGPAPGKRTHTDRPGAAAPPTPIETVIAHKHELVRDSHGFTYQINDEGAFVVFTTPPQLGASRGMVITADGRHGARWRELASLVMAGAAEALELAGDGPAGAAAAWFRAQYRQAAAGKPLPMRLATYATCIAARPAMLQQAYNALGGDAAAVKAGFEAFADELEVELIEALVTAPDPNLVWRSFADDHAETLARQPRLDAFRHRVVTRLLDRIAAGASAAAGDRGRALADVHVREIVVNHRQDFFAAACNGVHAWRMPPADPELLPNILSASGTLTGGIGGIMTEFFGTGVLKAAGIGLQGVAIVIGLAQVYQAYASAEQAKQQQIAEDGIRIEVLRGIEVANEAIKQQEDVIAALIATAAIQQGIDTESADRAPLRAFAWRQMFGTLPADASALRVAVTATIKKRLDPILGR